MSDESDKAEDSNNASLIGSYLTVLPILLAFGLYVFWPDAKTGDGETGWEATVRIFGFTVSSEARLLILVVLSGALGSCVHALTSFTTYVGNRSLVRSWTWWYFLRPFIGLSLAVMFYFVIRGGLLSAGANADIVSPFGVAAVAGLAGMFSKQATDKLRETFDNLFRTAEGKGDDVRGDKLRAKSSVKACMIPTNKMTTWQLAEGESEADVPVMGLHEKYGGIVTRIPVLDHNGLVKHVVHQSLVYKFVSGKVVESYKHGNQIEVDKLTLKNFLDSTGMKELVSDSLAFVAENASLGDAKELMDATPGCQDVFVTEHGVKTEEVKGWLTNVEIGRLSSA